MKLFKNGMGIILIHFIIASCGNTTVNTTKTFKVWGNCEMCKETIESSLDVKGIATAEWSPENKMIQVSYDSSIISLDQIQKNIAAVGYDNEKYKGDDNAYSKLPECCQYERKK